MLDIAVIWSVTPSFYFLPVSFYLEKSLDFV